MAVDAVVVEFSGCRVCGKAGHETRHCEGLFLVNQHVSEGDISTQPLPPPVLHRMIDVNVWYGLNVAGANRCKTSSSSLLLSSLDLSDTKVYEPYDANPARSARVSQRGEQYFFFFFTLVLGPRRSLSLNLSDARVYEL